MNSGNWILWFLGGLALAGLLAVPIGKSLQARLGAYWWLGAALFGGLALLSFGGFLLTIGKSMPLYTFFCILGLFFGEIAMLIMNARIRGSGGSDWD